MSSIPRREFVVFVEYNPKEQETFLYYLQWNGNEEKLTLLEDILTKADFSEYTGSKPAYTIDTTYKLSEEVVDAHKRVISITNYHKMFTKCTGEFKWSLKNLQNLLEMDAYEMTEVVYEALYGCKIKKTFSDYRNLYEELLHKKITREEYERLQKELE